MTSKCGDELHLMDPTELIEIASEICFFRQRKTMQNVQYMAAVLMIELFQIPIECLYV